MSMSTLVVSIKTVGDDVTVLDEVTRAHLIRGRSNGVEPEELFSTLGLSPLTGTIVALAVYDIERSEGTVYFVGEAGDVEERLGAFRYKPRSESALLAEFWEGVLSYDAVVTFTGRSFVLPYVVHRSVAHGVRPTVDLLRYRYLTQQVPPYHIDLHDQLTSYGAWRRFSSLFLFCRAYGIPSLQLQGIEGCDIDTLYRAKQLREIATVAGADVLATALLYEKWQTYLAPPLFQKRENEIDV